MDSPPGLHGPERAGTVGGTLLVVVLQLSAAQLLETVVLAAVGAVVSYGVSMALKWGLRRWRKE